MEPRAATTMLRAGEVTRRRALGPALLARYRRAGADPPFGDPARDHGARFEGYYWRITDADRGRVVIALCGVCLLPRRRWAVLALASHPSGRVHTVIADRAAGDPARFGVRAEGIGEGSERELRLALGPDAALEVELRDLVGWPRPALGGSGPAQLLPGLPQYWHPWAMGGLVAGEARIGGESVPLDGARVYVEKNWGRAFPKRWWWGQADAFEGGDVCVAFAGGPMRVAGVPLTPTLIAVRLGERLITLAPPLARTVARVGGGAWAVHARSAAYEVELEGDEAASAVALPVPLADRVATEPRSRQALAGRLGVVVRRRGRTLLRAESCLAGLEREREEGDCT
ncbi:MAG TPA: tocopherol cyclase family protein [Solirubrobacterales bacterium]|nr:tocopherol cyclase family protein [Solirubrobacterales bacterium]